MPFWALGALSRDMILPGLPLSALMVVAPVLVASVATARHEGRAALLRFLSQSFDAHKMRGWAWFIVLFTMPSAMILSAWLQLASGANLPPPAIDVTQTLILLVAFFVAATAEELGWTGFATQRLLNTQSILSTGLIVGFVAAVWHLLPLIQADRTWSWIAWWALSTVMRRIIIVWVYARGGRSVFGAALFHTMSNLAWMLFPVMGSHFDPKTTGLVLLVYATPVIVFEAAAKHAKSNRD